MTGRRDSGGTGTGGGGPTCLPVPLLPPPQRSSPPLSKSPVPLWPLTKEVWPRGRSSGKEGGAEEGRNIFLVSSSDARHRFIQRFLTPFYIHKVPPSTGSAPSSCMGMLSVPHFLKDEGPLTWGWGEIWKVICFVETNLMKLKLDSNLMCNRGWA